MPIRTEEEGIIIGKNDLPRVNEGDTISHAAHFEKIELIESQLEELMA